MGHVKLPMFKLKYKVPFMITIPNLNNGPKKILRCFVNAQSTWLLIPRNHYWRGSHSTIDLLVLTSLYQLVLILPTLFYFYFFLLALVIWAIVLWVPWIFEPDTYLKMMWDLFISVMKLFFPSDVPGNKLECFYWQILLAKSTRWTGAGNTEGGSITVPLTSCLTGLESAVWLLTIFVFICKTD